MPTYLTPEQERIRQLFQEGDPSANLVSGGAPAPAVGPPTNSGYQSPRPSDDYKQNLNLQTAKPSTAYMQKMRDRLNQIAAQGQSVKYYGAGKGGAINYANMYQGKDARSRLLRIVAAQQGTPYSWGGGNSRGATYGIGRGANTKGFDCSGLVQYAYAQIGIRMPRLAQSQATMGRRVSIRSLRPGDLVAGPGHIAIYAGNGMMWEAPRTGLRVRLTSVRSGMVGVALGF